MTQWLVQTKPESLFVSEEDFSGIVLPASPREPVLQGSATAAVAVLWDYIRTQFLPLPSFWFDRDELSLQRDLSVAFILKYVQGLEDSAEEVLRKTIFSS